MKRIVFFGDSITDADRSRTLESRTGWGYVTLVKSALSYEYPGEYLYFNRGVGGNRIVDLYARVKSDVINLKPDYVSIMIGVNDVWHDISVNDGVDVEKYRRVYKWLVEEIKSALPNVKIMILEPYVVKGTATINCEENPNKYETFMREVPLRAAAAKSIAEEFKLKFVPLQELFDQKSSETTETNWVMDGVHPAAAGCELIKREWIKAFEEIK